MSFSGKTVAVTGGGTGIGRATAKAFLERGARVLINGRRAEVLEKTARELDPSGKLVRVVPGDVARSEVSPKARGHGSRRLRRARRARECRGHLQADAVSGPHGRRSRRVPRSDPEGHLLRLAGGDPRSAQAGRRSHRQRGLDVGFPGHRRDTDRRVLGCESRGARAHAQPGHRVRQGQHPGQHDRAGRRGHARLSHVHPRRRTCRACLRPSMPSILSAGSERPTTSWAPWCSSRATPRAGSRGRSCPSMAASWRDVVRNAMKLARRRPSAA